jgi:hypothetical protein
MDLQNTTYLKLIRSHINNVNARLLLIKTSDIFTASEKEILTDNYEEEISILSRKMRQQV